MRRFVAVLALALAACSAAPPAPIATPTPFVPPAPVVTLPPLLGSGVITFGTGYDPDTLDATGVRTSFRTRVKNIAWSAALSEAAGATTLTWIMARVRPSGAETVMWKQDIDLANPESDTLANEGDLSFLLDRKAGTYVMRYLRDAEILAEGKFTLTK